MDIYLKDIRMDLRENIKLVDIDGKDNVDRLRILIIRKVVPNEWTSI